MIRTDAEAVRAYAGDAHWHDKLFLSRKLGYRCGVGVIPKTGKWIVRPAVNLDGMGRSAVIGDFDQGFAIGPGMFYSEVFEGRHISIDYVRKDGQWIQHSTFEGFNTPENLIQFSRWLRVDYPYPVPDFLRGVEADHINIEVKGGKIIEVHLRGNPDPVMHDDFWPIWSADQKPPFKEYIKIADKDDETEVGRLGFFVRDTINDY